MPHFMSFRLGSGRGSLTLTHALRFKYAGPNIMYKASNRSSIGALCRLVAMLTNVYGLGPNMQAKCSMLAPLPIRARRSPIIMAINHEKPIRYNEVQKNTCEDGTGGPRDSGSCFFTFTLSANNQSFLTSLPPRHPSSSLFPEKDDNLHPHRALLSRLFLARQHHYGILSSSYAREPRGLFVGTSPLSTTQTDGSWANIDLLWSCQLACRYSIASVFFTLRSSHCSPMRLRFLH